MKVLHINSYYSSSRFYKNLTDYLIIKGISTEVYVPISKKNKTVDFNYGHYTTLSRAYNYYNRFIFSWKHNKILKDIELKYNFDNFNIIHAHSLFSNGYIAYRLNKKYGIPYIVAVRNTDLNLFFKKMIFLRKLGVNILKNASKIIFLSESYKNQVINKYISLSLKEEIKIKSIVIPNGVDDFWIRNSVNEKKKKPNELKILHVGDINRNKNIILTLEAIRYLNSIGIISNLTSVGKIKNKIIYNRIKKDKYFKYLGVLDKNQLLKTYREHDIFVMPSYKETFGLVYAEALTQGLPIIYSSGQGFDKHFDEGEVGFSVNPHSIKDISKKIALIIDFYENLSEKAISKSKIFDWQIISVKYVNLYLECKK